MRAVRFSIAGVMGVVAIVAVGFAALRSGSPEWLGGLFLTTRAVLGVAWIGALCRQGEKRAWWIGFALFGWIYMGCSFAPHESWPIQPMQFLLDDISSRIDGDPGRFGRGNMAVGPLFTVWHCLWTLLAAVFGGFLARTLSSATARKTADDSASSQQPAPRQVNRWMGRFLLYLTCLELALLVFFGARVLPLALWASLTYLFTWWLLGLFALRARHGPANQRDFWLGAALLGTLFMIVAFSRFDDDPWPVIPTVDLLDEMRPSLPNVMTGYPAGWDNRSPENARVYQALDRKLKMQFVDETPLEDFLKYIQTNTIDADGKSIAIHVPSAVEIVSHPAGPLTVQSLEFDGVSVRTSLRLALAQFDATYHVKEGELVFVKEGELVFVKEGELVFRSKESVDEWELSGARDGFQIVGHCVLALIAAALAGVLSSHLRGASRPVQPSRIATAE